MIRSRSILRRGRERNIGQVTDCLERLAVIGIAGVTGVKAKQMAESREGGQHDPLHH